MFSDSIFHIQTQLRVLRHAAGVYALHTRLIIYELILEEHAISEIL